ncbi:MAG: hypothetical protein WBN97_02975 [Parvibaculum sp.]
MTRLILVAMMGVLTAVGAALAADTRHDQKPVIGIEERAVIISAIDPDHRSVLTGEPERVTFPVYFTPSEARPTTEARLALTAVADEITVRGLEQVKVAPSTEAQASLRRGEGELGEGALSADRVLSVSHMLESYGVPAHWIDIELPDAAGV